MSATIRAAAALLDASYQIEDTAKADIWREMAVEARQEYDQLRAERDASLARVKEISRDTTQAWNDHLKVCSEAAAIVEVQALEAKVKHENSERMRLDGLRADLVRERDELSPYRAEALLVRQQLDAMMVPTTVTKPDGSKVTLETWERVRLVVEQRGEATSELARMKARPVEAEHSRLDVMWQQLVRERDEAQANYRFMVERAADQKLDGYRELGARAAAAENERDSWKSAAESQNRQWSQKCTEVTELRAEFERVQGERDEACEELETLRALIEGEPWAGAVTRRERDKAREERDDAREALANIIRKCPRNCTRESYCGVCAVALVALPEDYEL